MTLLVYPQPELLDPAVGQAGVKPPSTLRVNTSMSQFQNYSFGDLRIRIFVTNVCSAGIKSF